MFAIWTFCFKFLDKAFKCLINYFTPHLTETTSVKFSPLFLCDVLFYRCFDILISIWHFFDDLQQRFSIPVLAPHRSAHFVCYSYHFRRLFYSNASALRSGHHTIFLHDSSSKRTYSIHSALNCARREFKLYIFTDVYDVTLVRA